MNINSQKLSSARFAQATDAFVEIFTASVDFDKRMANQDIQGSLAHAKMLCKVGVLTEEERDLIIQGLLYHVILMTKMVFLSNDSLRNGFLIGIFPL